MTLTRRNTMLFSMAGLCLMAVSCASLTGNTGPIVETGTVVEKLAGGFVFTEGPVSDRSGNVIFSDVRASKTYKWQRDGHVVTVRENTGGGNGLYFDDTGNLIVCEGRNRRVTSMDRRGKVSVIVDEYKGKKFNSPNDLWIDPKGGIYFTDPRYGRDMDPMELDGQHVFYVSPDRKSVKIVADDVVKPNGIIGTKDGKTLYVADPGAGRIYVYTINKDASLSNRKLFASQGSDGMTLDERGNLYLTQGVISVYAPDGSKVRDIDVPEKPANVTFGGTDGTTLFITARTSLYALEMNVRGQ